MGTTILPGGLDSPHLPRVVLDWTVHNPPTRWRALPRLENGQTFPSLQVPLVGGGTLSLPEDLSGGFGVVLVYRGAWCPYCKG